MTPEVNARYRKNGFEFLIDEVSATEVRMRRWRSDSDMSCRWLKVSREVWERDIQGAKRVDGRGEKP